MRNFNFSSGDRSSRLFYCIFGFAIIYVLLENPEQPTDFASRRLAATEHLSQQYDSLISEEEATNKAKRELKEPEEDKSKTWTFSKTDHVPGRIFNKTDMPTGLRLVMLGDSLTRYQYLSLAYFLAHQEWIDPNEHDLQITNERSGFDGWNDFFNHTNGALHPYEYCDCYRDQPSETMCENRYFYDAELDNVVVLHLALGHKWSIHGRYSPEDFVQLREGGPPPLPLEPEEAHLEDLKYQHKDYHSFVREHLSKYDFDPTHVLINVGWWPNNFTSNHDSAYHRQEIRNELVQSVRDVNMTSIWKTTTYRKDHGSHPWIEESDKEFCETMAECLNVSWTAKVDEEFYWDDYHFWEPMYRSMNEELLGMLGYEFPSYYQKIHRPDYYEEQFREEEEETGVEETDEPTVEAWYDRRLPLVMHENDVFRPHETPDADVKPEQSTRAAVETNETPEDEETEEPAVEAWQHRRMPLIIRKNDVFRPH